MPTDRERDKTISTWLEADAPRELPDFVLRATFERTRKTRQQGRWRALQRGLAANRSVFALGAAAVVVVVAVGVLNVGRQPGGVGGSGTPTPSSAVPSTVFEGSWTAVDPADGSGMTLVVGSGATPAVYFEDGYAAGAACLNDAVKRFTARGTGELLGSLLVATFPDGGGCGLETVPVAGTYRYEGLRDTLTGQDGVVWTRVLGQRLPENPAAATTGLAEGPHLLVPTTVGRA